LQDETRKTKQLSRRKTDDLIVKTQAEKHTRRLGTELLITCHYKKPEKDGFSYRAMHDARRIGAFVDHPIDAFDSEPKKQCRSQAE
jgi:hypothetical protein